MQVSILILLFGTSTSSTWYGLMLRSTCDTGDTAVATINNIIALIYLHAWDETAKMKNKPRREACPFHTTTAAVPAV